MKRTKYLSKKKNSACLACVNDWTTFWNAYFAFEMQHEWHKNLPQSRQWTEQKKNVNCYGGKSNDLKKIYTILNVIRVHRWYSKSASWSVNVSAQRHSAQQQHLHTSIVAVPIMNGANINNTEMEFQCRQCQIGVMDFVTVTNTAHVQINNLSLLNLKYIH